jgi:8-oxo-dGTP diphosphatase
MSCTPRLDVVAALLFSQGRVLACQRRPGGSFPLKWEFPGGKVEPGENAAAALARELLEELGIVSEGFTQVFAHVHSYPNTATVNLRFFVVARFAGELVNHVFEQIRWVEPEELEPLDFLEGDRVVVRWLLSDSARAFWQRRKG